MRAALPLLVLLWTYSVSLAQPTARGNVWYFGQNAGLTFGGAGPQALTDGQLNTPEGCASVSNLAGNLLFYTDGDKIYNRNHALMPGATGLGGSPRSTQAALIVPHPNRSWLYFVFSVADGTQSTGIQYRLVDMTLQGGLGGIAAPSKTLSGNSTEKLTIIPHCNKSNYWLILHEKESATFRVHLINDNGLVTSPTLFRLGSSYQPGQYRGYLKPSADGRKLAAAVSGPTATEPGFVEIFDFNDKTGVISNPRKWESPAFAGAYGVEFSPDGSRLYLSAGRTLHQLETASLNTLVTFPTSSELGALQGGPDGKIYVARVGEGHLGVIAAPNAAGSGCGWTEQGVFLDGKKSGLGLPFAFLQTPILPPSLAIARQDGRTCNEFLLTSQLTNLDPNHLTFQWYRDGLLIPGATSPTYRPVRAGMHQLKVRETECLDRTVLSNEVPVPILELDPRAASVACGTFQLAARATAPVAWSGVGITSALAALDSFRLLGPAGRQTYRVRTTSPLDAGCFLEKEITVLFDVPAPYRLDSASRTVCGDRLSVDLRPTTDWDTFRWITPDGGTGQGTTLTATRSGSYPITVLSSRTGCESRADLTVTLNPNPTVHFPQNELQTCFENGLNVVLNAGPPEPGTYEWTKDGALVGTTPTLTVSDYGQYALRVRTAGGCQALDSVRVGSNCPPPSFKLAIPDVFTPNGDGVNDTFLIQGASVARFDLRIFDRWGEVVYRAEDQALPESGLESWDGTVGGIRVPPGTYAYQLRAYSPAFSEGKSFTRRGAVRVVW